MEDLWSSIFVDGHWQRLLLTCIRYACAPTSCHTCHVFAKTWMSVAVMWFLTGRIWVFLFVTCMWIRVKSMMLLIQNNNNFKNAVPIRVLRVRILAPKPSNLFAQTWTEHKKGKFHGPDPRLTWLYSTRTRSDHNILSLTWDYLVLDYNKFVNAT